MGRPPFRVQTDFALLGRTRPSESQVALTSECLPPCLHRAHHPQLQFALGPNSSPSCLGRTSEAFPTSCWEMSGKCGPHRHSCSASNSSPSPRPESDGAWRSLNVNLKGWGWGGRRGAGQEVPPEVYLKDLERLILFPKHPLTSSRAEFCFRTLVFISASSTDRVTFWQFSWVRTPGRGPCLPIPVPPPNPSPRWFHRGSSPSFETPYFLQSAHQLASLGFRDGFLFRPSPSAAFLHLSPVHDVIPPSRFQILPTSTPPFSPPDTCSTVAYLELITVAF